MREEKENEDQLDYDEIYAAVGGKKDVPYLL